MILAFLINYFFCVCNNVHLLFTATEATVGAELWKLNNSGLSNTTSDFDENSIQIYSLFCDNCCDFLKFESDLFLTNQMEWFPDFSFEKYLK